MAPTITCGVMNSQDLETGRQIRVWFGPEHARMLDELVENLNHGAIVPLTQSDVVRVAIARFYRVEIGGFEP